MSGAPGTWADPAAFWTKVKSTLNKFRVWLSVVLFLRVKKLFLIAIFMLIALPASPDWTEREPEFTFARLQCSNRESDSWKYWPAYFPDNPPWHHDYPFAEELLVGLLHELTRVSVAPNSYKIVRLDSSDVFKHPFLYLSEPGFLSLNDKEIANLGEYIRRGGFIMADDFRGAGFLEGGPEELEVLRYYLRRAVPEMDLVRLTPGDPIFHAFYDVDIRGMSPPYELPKPPEFWGLADKDGRLHLVANYNNDIGDFWKYLDQGDKPLRDSARAIRLGINYVVYSTTH